MPMCVTCDMDIQNLSLIQCTKCEKEYHFHCSNIRAAQWKNYTEDQKSRHVCVNCRQPTQRMEELIDALRKDLIAEFNKSTAETNKKIEELQNSMQFINCKFEENKKVTDKIIVEMADSKRQIVQLEAENSTLKSTLCNVQRDIVELQQRTRIQNIEIKGFPETENEDLMAVLFSLAQFLKVPFEPDCINVVHRTQAAEGRIRPIVVNFFSRELKKLWVDRARKLRSINARDINRRLANSKIYINEHLCPANKRLLGRANAARRALPAGSLFKYIWSHEGKIFCKKEVGARTEIIRCDEDIVKYIGDIPDDVNS